MKPITFILALFLLTGNKPDETAIDNKRDFRLKISFTQNLSLTSLNYTISVDSLCLTKYFYFTKLDSFSEIKKESFKEYHRDKLIHFINQTNWSAIPQELRRREINGYILKIDLSHGNRSWHYKIFNYYHPTIDSLLSICNRSIPKRKEQKEFRIDYR